METCSRPSVLKWWVMNGCHAHGFAWACLWGSDHAHAKPWAWHPPFWNGRSRRVGRGFARPTIIDMGGTGGFRKASTHPTKLVILAFVLIFPSPSIAQSPTPFASVSADQKRIQLSESTRAVIVITGAAPLRVELPKKLLVPESDRDWKIQPIDRAKVVPLLGHPGLECWVQTYRLDPYVTGNALSIEFAPLKVNGKEITPPGLEVTVLS